MSDELLDTKDDGLQARISAREQLRRPGQHPHMHMKIFDPPKRDAQGKVIGEARECDAQTGFVNGGGLPERHYERRPDETLKEFKTRVLQDLPVNGEPRFVIFGLNDKAPTPATAPDPTPTEA
jgi:hypothetical protein